ncbi:zinc ion binding / nucleic acid binding protein [Trifolium repens]|nr:zinc ion binding / nucleic acid binding protein [Trifolium repens]
MDAALLGQKNKNTEKSTAEKDLQERSTKKVKNGDQPFAGGSSMPKDYTDLLELQKETSGGGRSYKETVLGGSGNGPRGYESEEDEVDSEQEEEGEGIKVEEHMVGGYDCPAFVLSKVEEKRIYRPWKRGVIVKLLGRRIGYKALETRLKQMWVRSGIINIIDLGNDYYLVAFSHEDDQSAALLNGPWFIYDHYLTMKEWSPNFHPASDTIKKVAVWVRISGLPIEYYDAKVLKSVGDRVGRTVKVDKNTLTQERGKYARLCVEVDLTKPLLAMFTIKERKYNVEYEGLHLLCTTCGKFGHYKEGCPDKVKQPERRSENEGGVTNGSGGVLARNNVEGPWVVVQKPKRVRKGKDREAPAEGRKPPAQEGINGVPNLQGSRFASLSEEDTALNEDEVMILEGNEIENNQEEQEKIQEETMGVNDGGNHEVRNELGQRNKAKFIARKISNENTTKDGKLAARGPQSFKSKFNTNLKKGGENLHVVLRDKKMTQLLEDQIQRPNGSKKGEVTWSCPSNSQEVQRVNNEGQRVDNNDVGHKENLTLGQRHVLAPNIPRPPNLLHTPPVSNILVQQNQSYANGESDEFVDANEHGSEGNSDSDMEIVGETPLQLQ